ncbi:unnamed protein product [Tetraodon nigroviridis]|uniref:Chromosome undetermined SCAF5283, whole genome shotgun sequence n=1 Tax=Tetraodon nigroviridis TaxID=99883 RepID=Q4TEL4_TETNG|nr:unnamed protein product [Tetraodon nigroviridis]
MLMVSFPIQEFHESLHSLLLWLDHAERRCDAASISQPDTPASALQDHRHTLQVGTLQLSAAVHDPAPVNHGGGVPQALLEELQQRQARHTSLQLLWSQLQPEEAAEDSLETREKIRVTGSKLRLLLKQVDGGLGALRRHLVSGERAGGLISALGYGYNQPRCLTRTVRLRQTSAAAQALLQRSPRRGRSP